MGRKDRTLGAGEWELRVQTNTQEYIFNVTDPGQRRTITRFLQNVQDVSPGLVQDMQVVRVGDRPLEQQQATQEPRPDRDPSLEYDLEDPPLPDRKSESYGWRGAGPGEPDLSRRFML